MFLSSDIKVFLALGHTDMRKSFRGLTALVQSQLDLDPHSGQLFVFCNRRRTLLKALRHDATGLFLIAKKLNSGTFFWPTECDFDEAKLEVTAVQLMLLLEGQRWQSMTPAKKATKRRARLKRRSVPRPKFLGLLQKS